MNKRKTIKIIFNVLLTFIVILSISCGDLQVFAENPTYTVTWYHELQGSGPNFYIVEYSSGSSYTHSFFGFSGTQSFSQYFTSVDYFEVYFRFTYSSKSRYADYITIGNYNLSYNSSNPSVIPLMDSISFTCTGSTQSVTKLYFTFEQPTPEPTPTPTPAPTPTPLPVDYDDTQFWGRMNNIAEGGWNAVTATFNGIFNNTVFRNLVVYVPLFGAIIYLFVYLLFMGSD